ncbi:DUF1963 domain-containing protein [Amycolatopsis dongchuanensis]|uniref:DUF1963 domain-containing protein n=1 Tax=Amycolatopsis dongchuanensis TaxID=1070866 RepID=A0ABP9Q4Z1_9PSEU
MSGRLEDFPVTGGHCLAGQRDRKPVAVHRLRGLRGPSPGRGLPLPADGSLLFFLNQDDDFDAICTSGTAGAAQVLYVPAGTETVVAPPPPGHDTVFSHDPNIPFLTPEYPLSAWVAPELPEWLEERDVQFEPDSVKQLFDELKHVDELCELVDELWPPREGVTFRFGGYCEEIGGSDSPWTVMAKANLRDRLEANPDLPRSERFRLRDAEEDRLIREWVPLVQFYTQSDVHYGCFLISRDDLAAKRFDRMRSFTMFSE